MASFASPTAATYDGQFHRGRLSPPQPKWDGDDPSLHPSSWIILAEDALTAGRIGKAEELVEQAYLAYDVYEAIANVVADRLRFGEEEPELDAE
jgi:hypothetical protein